MSESDREKATCTKKRSGGRALLRIQPAAAAAALYAVEHDLRGPTRAPLTNARATLEAGVCVLFGEARCGGFGPRAETRWEARASSEPRARASRIGVVEVAPRERVNEAWRARESGHFGEGEKNTVSRGFFNKHRPRLGSRLGSVRRNRTPLISRDHGPNRASQRRERRARHTTRGRVTRPLPACDSLRGCWTTCCTLTICARKL